MNGCASPSRLMQKRTGGSLCAILVSAGLSVRVVKARYGTSKNPPLKKFVEYRAEWKKSPLHLEGAFFTDRGLFSSCC